MATPPRPVPTLAPAELAHLEGISDVLTWLGAVDSQDPAQDLAAFRLHLQKVTQADLSIVQFHRLLDLFQERARKLSLSLRPFFASAALPLERPVRSAAEGLHEVHRIIAAGYTRILQQMADRPVRNKRRNPAVIAARGLRCLYEQLTTAFCIAASAPPQLWIEAHRLYSAASADKLREEEAMRGAVIEAEKTYKAMLALAIAHREGLSPCETNVVADYLENHAVLVDLMRDKPTDGSASWFWLDRERDMGLVPSNRRIPGDHGPLLFVSCLALAHRLGEQLGELETGKRAAELALPSALDGTVVQNALRRAQQNWNMPPHRHYSRRPNTYRAHLCVGLDDLWRLLQNRSEGTGDEQERGGSTEWMVLNESAAGFAVTHVAGKVERLRTGSVIALRSESPDSWNICIVRWMRSDNSEHIELGLELIAPNAESVNIVFRNGNTEQKPTPGLLLPPVRALRQHPAIIAPCGSYSSRRFFIVSGEDKTHIAQGRLLSLDLKTDSIELFQFEADPTP